MTALEWTRGVLDTSTVILLPRLSDPTVLPAEPLITAVTLAELSVGPLVARSDQERAARQAHLQQAETDFDSIPFDAAAARAFGQVAASLRRSGRKRAQRAYDAMIAATALANGLPVYTCNPFQRHRRSRRSRSRRRPAPRFTTTRLSMPWPQTTRQRGNLRQ